MRENWWGFLLILFEISCAIGKCCSVLTCILFFCDFMIFSSLLDVLDDST